MKTRSLAALLLLAAAPPAQNAANPRAAYERFLAENPGYWAAEWDPATSTPRAIWGEGVPLAGWRFEGAKEASRRGRDFLERHADLLGLSDCAFRQRPLARMGGTYVPIYDQYYRGLPVLGGRADLRIHETGRIPMLGSRALPIPRDFATVPSIDELNAERLAWMSLGIAPPPVAQPGARRKTRLVIWSDRDANSPQRPILAWEVPISAVDADGEGPIGRVFVDAKSGAIAHYENDKHDCRGGDPADGGSPSPAEASPPPAVYTVMAYARAGLAGNGPIANAPVPGLEVHVPGLGILVTDQNGQFTANLSQPVAVAIDTNGIHNQVIAGSSAPVATATLQPGTGSVIQLLGSSATGAEVAHTSCYEWIYRANEYSRSIPGNSPELAIADNVLPTVNIARTCNAYYTNNTINFFAAGGNCNNTAFSTVVVHEWGHGLDDRYGGVSQTQGLSEGWGDTLAMYVADDPIVGLAFFTNGNSIRDGNNTRQYPPPSEVHAAGEVFMGFAWKFRQNLRANLGTPQALAISGTDVIGSIAADATDQPGAVREVFIADDDDGNLANGVPHYNELEAACLAHNLPYPVRQLGTLAHDPLGQTGDQLVPRVVRVTATPISGGFTALRLHYDDGTPHQRPLIPTGNPGEYEALLPGALAPSTISYHIEADHTAAATLRLPLTGEFSYQVLGQTRVYLEDFEGGGAGWAHQAISGTDDWQIGAPAGLLGPGFRDPPAAHSGALCAGNDLGIPGDGAYAPSSWSYLRSPPIDCSAFAGLRLRFQRWLTIESAATDQAFLVINGAQYYWMNPATGPTVDQAWTLFELAVPGMDGRANATVEFRLRTDAQGQRGGWTVDDVELFASNLPVPLPRRLTLLPEQAPQGAPMLWSVRAPGPGPFLMVLGDQPGPTPIPGVGAIAVGGGMIGIPGATDLSGRFDLPFAAPLVGSALSIRWYTQVVAIDAAGALVLTNPFANLFTR